MRFRRRGFRGGKGRREPLIWARGTNSQGTSAGGGIAGLELYDPDFLLSDTALSTDQRWTLRRFILNGVWAVTTGFTTPTNPLMLFAGIWMANQSASGLAIRDPQMLTADDTRADWLWLGSAYIQPLTAAAGGGAAQCTIDPAYGCSHIDIRTNRKMNSENSPGLAFKVVDMTTGTNQAAGVLTLRYQFSALWSRTRR